jgi:hypothetical protein
MGRRTTAAITGIGALVAVAATLLVTATPAAAQASTAATATTTEAADTYCDVTFTVMSQWSTGYGVGLSVRNVSTVPVRWQLVKVWFPAPVLTALAWDASVSQLGSVVTATAPADGDVLAVGETRMVAIFYESGRFLTPPPYQVLCAPA